MASAITIKKEGGGPSRYEHNRSPLIARLFLFCYTTIDFESNSQSNKCALASTIRSDLVNKLADIWRHRDARGLGNCIYVFSSTVLRVRKHAGELL